MTISTTTIKNSYSGNGSTTTFNYTFKITDQDDIDVIIRSASGTETTKTITTHYTVSGVGNSGGGSVIFSAGNIPTNTETVLLRRSTPLTQGVDLIENDPLPANTLEDALDKLTSFNQELQEQLDRSLKVSKTTTITTPEFTADATARAGKLLGFSSDGNTLEATIDSDSAAQAATSATNAASSATAAASSATAATNAKNAAEAALDTFDDDFIGSKSSNPSVDNDGNALADGALYFDTTNNVMKVYDLGNTVWKQLTPTSSQQTNIDAAVANATKINNVAGQIAPTNNIQTVVTNIGDSQTVAGISNIGTLGTNAAAVVNAGNNITGINSFAERYRVQAGVPSSSNDVGDLVFDTTAGKLKVFDGSSYALAGSSVNGTSARFRFVATAGQTTFSGNDANGNSLTYDVASGTAFADIYLNGVKLDTSDFTATSGTSIVLGSAAQLNDVLVVVAFGTFNLASFAASNITSGTLPTTRGGTGLSTLGTAGQALVVNAGGNALEFSNASSAEVYGFNKYYNPSTLVKTVTVVSVGGANKYFIDGVQQDTLELYEGNTYVFNYPSAHPFKFSTTSNGSHGGGSEYTTGVTHNSSTQVTIVVATGAPTLYYYCSSHSNMGGTANTPTPGPNNLQVTTTNKGADNIDSSTYAAFDDVLFSASGFTFSISNGILIATI